MVDIRDKIVVMEGQSSKSREGVCLCQRVNDIEQTTFSYGDKDEGLCLAYQGSPDAQQMPKEELKDKFFLKMGRASGSANA